MKKILMREPTFGFSVKNNNIIETQRKAQEIKQRIAKKEQKKKRIRAIEKLLNEKTKVKEQKKKETYQVFIERLRQYHHKERQKLISRKATKILQAARKAKYIDLDSKKPGYKVINRWRMHKYKTFPLTRSEEGLTPVYAWVLLEKCWDGYKICTRYNDLDGMRFYARGIQKYAYLLEEIEPDFSHLGLKPYKYFIEE